MLTPAGLEAFFRRPGLMQSASISFAVVTAVRFMLHKSNLAEPHQMIWGQRSHNRATIGEIGPKQKLTATDPRKNKKIKK